MCLGKDLHHWATGCFLKTLLPYGKTTHQKEAQKRLFLYRGKHQNVSSRRWKTPIAKCNCFPLSLISREGSSHLILKVLFGKHWFRSRPTPNRPSVHLYVSPTMLEQVYSSLLEAHPRLFRHQEFSSPLPYPDT